MIKKFNKLWDCFSNQKNIYVNYRRKVWNETVIILLLLLTTVFITAGFFYICKLLWSAYILTPVGKQYSAVFTENSQVIFKILSSNCISFSIELTLQTFYVCFAICAACQFFSLARFFYLPREFFGRLCFWGFPMAVVVAIYLRPIYEFADWEMALFLSVVPTLIIFSGCFRFTGLLLPELYEIILYSIKKCEVIKKYFLKGLLPRLQERAQDIINRINAS